MITRRVEVGGGHQGAQARQKVHGVEHDGSGAVLERLLELGSSTFDIPAPVAVTDVASSCASPAVAWSGSAYGVVWEDDRDSGVPTQIYFGRISTSGAPIVANTRISLSEYEAAKPGIVWTGSRWVVGWTHGLWPYSVFVTRLWNSGSKVGSDLTVTTTAAYNTKVDLVWTGSEVGMVWDDIRDGPMHIYMNRMDVSGAKAGTDTRIDNSPTVSTNWPGNPSISWTGSEFGVTLADSVSSDWEIFFTRATALGAKVSGDVRVTDVAGTSNGPSIAWSGSMFAIAWIDARDGHNEVYITLLTAAGVESTADTGMKISSIAKTEATIAWAADSWAVAHRENTWPNEVLFGYIDPSTLP